MRSRRRAAEPGQRPGPPRAPAPPPGRRDRGPPGRPTPMAAGEQFDRPAAGRRVSPTIDGRRGQPQPSRTWAAARRSQRHVPGSRPASRQATASTATGSRPASSRCAATGIVAAVGPSPQTVASSTAPAAESVGQPGSATSRPARPARRRRARSGHRASGRAEASAAARAPCNRQAPLGRHLGEDRPVRPAPGPRRRHRHQPQLPSSSRATAPAGRGDAPTGPGHRHGRPCPGTAGAQQGADHALDLPGRTGSPARAARPGAQRPRPGPGASAPAVGTRPARSSRRA